ncbi:hypothetical protein BP6252_08362 [Coleophoma cylindrospora]|uniref:DNA-directed RNA polymerase III subunit rpc5 n=1 Tax=Coleophoma cylindrospora TaxID=1849047 RepID=A0A3D8R5K8_9HELO|nr:hypothetical protein BP6252_08362 [Coleophoma cylindrospora]
MTDSDIEETDPIKASYDVFIKPQMSDSRQIYILQFPNRDSKQHYSASNDSQPFKLRIKPQSGMLELDVPLDAWRNYDKEKGLKWGEVMRKSNKQGQSHGMPGGFGIGGGPPAAGRGRGAREELSLVNQERLLADYAGAIQREQVLVKQTLGGQSVPPGISSPQYMVGTFRQNQLHLTPISHIVQMRPQFHHIDAAVEQERQSRPRETAAGARTTEQRPVHQTAKTTVDGEEESTESMSDRVTAAQQETWRGHRYIDEDSAEAWSAFHENLFVGADTEEKEEDEEELPDADDIAKGGAAAVGGPKDKGKGKAVEKDLKEKVPRLVSRLDDARYLDTISAPNDAVKLSRSKRVKKRKGKGKAAEGDASDSSSTLSEASSDEEEDDADVVVE